MLDTMPDSHRRTRCTARCAPPSPSLALSPTHDATHTPSFLQILAHLNLTSLFRLSQTSHALRGTLLSPSATLIWLNSGAKILTGATAVIPENARQKAPEEALPPPVRDLSIREFFSLLFDDVCDVRWRFLI